MFKIISADMLRSASDLIGLVSEKSNVQQITKFCFRSLDDNKMELSATDGIIKGVSCFDVLSGDTPQQEFFIIAKPFYDFLNALPEQELNLRLDLEENKVELSLDTGSFEFSDVEGQPIFQGIQENKIFSLTLDWRELFNKVLFAAMKVEALEDVLSTGNQENRMLFTGIYFGLEKIQERYKIHIIASDRLRIIALVGFVDSIDGELPSDNFSIFIDRRGIEQIIKMKATEISFGNGIVYAKNEISIIEMPVESISPSDILGVLSELDTAGASKAVRVSRYQLKSVLAPGMALMDEKMVELYNIQALLSESRDKLEISGVGVASKFNNKVNILNTLSRRFNFDFWINPRYLYDFVELIDLDDFDLIILDNSVGMVVDQEGDLRDYKIYYLAAMME